MRCTLQTDALRLQHIRHLLHLQTNHVGNLFLRQRGEGDNLIDTVQELGTHGGTKLFTRGVRGHDDDGVLEVGRTTLVVGQTTVIQHLQQDVEHIGMGFFYFIEQHHRVGLTAYSLSELSTLIVTYVSRRGTNQTGDAILLLILTHIDTRHHRLIIEQIVGQGLGQFGLTDTCGAQEDERGDGSLGILQACP